MDNKNHPRHLLQLPRRAIPAATTLLLAVLLIVMAAADPAGLFAVLPWTGGYRVAAFWWWGPYVLFLPLLLLLYFWAVHSVVRYADADVTRAQLMRRSWLVLIPVTVAAWWINAVLVLYLSMSSATYVLPMLATLHWLLWAGGYPALKLALLGWLPTLPVWLLRPDDGTPVGMETGIAASSPWAAAAIGTALFAWLSSGHWQGGPLAFVDQEIPMVLAPCAGAGWIGATLALMIYLLISAWVMGQRGSSRSAASGRTWLTGVLSGVVAVLALLLAQIAVTVIGVSATTPSDVWLVPATVLLARETMSCALIAACCNGLALRATRYLHDPASYPVVFVSILIALASMTLPIFRQATPSTVGLPAGHGDAVMVRHDRDGAVLSNRRGAQLLLRGVNVNQLGEYYQANPDLAAVQPLTRQDFVDMAALGINVVRLTLSWSRLEPVGGGVDGPASIARSYLDQISEAVAWAAEQQIYVVLDMHQDAWGMSVAGAPASRCHPGTAPMTGWDGAPAWATLTDGAPACQFTGRDLAPNVSRAFQSFYMDRDGIQTALLQGWAALASRFAASPNVVGYDLLNEPNFAETPPVSSTLLLTNFYARAINTIRRAEHDAPGGFIHPVMIEPSIFWSGFGLDNLPPSDVLPDQQLVFAPHLYNESITSDQDLGVNLISIERGFRLARAAANQMHAALWIGEWGWFGDSRQQSILWQRQAAAEDRGQTGSALWVWKQACGDPHVYPGSSAGNVWRADCPGNTPDRIDPVAKKILQRPYLRLAPGRVGQFALTPDTLTFSGTLNHQQPGNACDLQLWIPGTQRPQARVIEGIASISWQRVGSGSPAMGHSGGWILRGCATGASYHASLSWRADD